MTIPRKRKLEEAVILAKIAFADAASKPGPMVENLMFSSRREGTVWIVDVIQFAPQTDRSGLANDLLDPQSTKVAFVTVPDDSTPCEVTWMNTPSG